jgi:hypothetical protein
MEKGLTRSSVRCFVIVLMIIIIIIFINHLNNNYKVMLETNLNSSCMYCNLELEQAHVIVVLIN